jgi:hypothetical protein
VEGDYEQFRRAVTGLNGAKVLLDSPGGLAQEGLQIGKLVSSLRLETAVASKTMCASACGFIWLAGKRRAVEEGGRVGFHAVYLSDEQQSISSSGNALVGAYLSRLGFNDLVVVYVTEAAPRELRWLTPRDASFLGLEVAWAQPQESTIEQPVLTRDDIRRVLLLDEAEQAMLRRFPEWFELHVDAIYDAQAAGENADAATNKFLESKENGKYSEVLRSQSSADLIIKKSRNNLRLFRKLLTYDPALCAGFFGIFPVDLRKMAEAEKDPELGALINERGKHFEMSLIEAPVQAKPLTKRERARLERKLRKAYSAIRLSKSEIARMKKPDMKRDAVLMCRFAIKFEETMLKDPELLIAWHRYPDLLE